MQRGRARPLPLPQGLLAGKVGLNRAVLGRLGTTAKLPLLPAARCRVVSAACRSSSGAALSAPSTQLRASEHTMLPTTATGIRALRAYLSYQTDQPGAEPGNLSQHRNADMSRKSPSPRSRSKADASRAPLPSARPHARTRSFRWHHPTQTT